MLSNSAVLGANGDNISRISLIEKLVTIYLWLADYQDQGKKYLKDGNKAEAIRMIQELNAADPKLDLKPGFTDTEMDSIFTSKSSTKIT